MSALLQCNRDMSAFRLQVGTAIIFVASHISFATINACLLIYRLFVAHIYTMPGFTIQSIHSVGMVCAHYIFSILVLVIILRG